MRLVIIILLGLVSPVLNSQTTWQGIKFGQDRATISKALLEKKMTLDPDDNSPTVTVTPDSVVETSSPMLSANLHPQVAKAPLYFIPTLVLDKQGLLREVRLNLDQASTFKATAELKEMKPLLTFIAGTSLYEQLADKYGKPTSTSGPCSRIELALLVGATTECNARWSSDGQTVELHWDYRFRLNDLRFFVAYKPLSSAL